MDNQNARTNIICTVLLVALVFVVFGRTLGQGFINYDDDQATFGNPAVVNGLSTASVKWAFTHSVNQNWVPLTTLSHMLDCQLYGINPHGHHFTNVLIHAVTVLLLFLALRRMTDANWKSLFVAAVFAIHPLRVESIAWISERKDVLSGLFFMLTLIAYARYCEQKTRAGRLKGYALTLLMFVCGLMSKPMLVTVPIVLLLLDYWPLRRLMDRPSFRRCLLEKIPFFALSALDCVATLLTQTDAVSVNQSLDALSKCCNAANSYLIYIRQMFFPSGLTVFYVHPGRNVSVVLGFVCLALLVGISIILWKQRQRRPYLVIGWAWYVVMLLPVIGLVQVGAQAHADRYTYLPQIGLYVLVTWAAVEFWSRFTKPKWVLPAAAFCIVGLLATTAYAQSAYWTDSETLWRRSIACTGPNELTEFYLGIALEEKGKIDQAAQSYETALQLNPQYPEAHNNLGNLLLRQGNITAAAEHFKAALTVKPTMATALFNLANVYVAQNNYAEAIDLNLKAIAANPDYEAAYYNLGTVYLNQGKVVEAVPPLQRATALNPANMLAQLNLANALAQQGRLTEAIGYFERAIQLDPTEPRTYFGFGMTLSMQGRNVEALQRFQQAFNAAQARNDAQTAETARSQIQACEAALRKASAR